MTARSSARPIVIGISSCLLGQEVRHDGGHKRHAWINQTLGRFFEFHPVCPEVGIGLGVPRPTIQLTGDVDNPRVTGTENPELDVTEALTDYGRKKARELAGISGYIFKARSPSCGVWRVNVWPGQDQPAHKEGRGIYARAFMKSQPLLPVEEEGRLDDSTLQENFIERVFAYRRWQELMNEGLSPAALYAPGVMAASGWQDPYTTSAGFRTPGMAQAAFPELKSHMTEHHWLQGARADCNASFEDGTYDGCEPFYFNHSIESVPQTLFYDGHVQGMRIANAVQYDSPARPLWLRGIPTMPNGYFGEEAYDWRTDDISVHILTVDGILDRDMTH